MAPIKDSNVGNKSAFSIYKKKKTSRGKIKKLENTSQIKKKFQGGSSERKYLTNSSDHHKNKNLEQVTSIGFQNKIVKCKNSKQKNKRKWESVSSLEKEKNMVGSRDLETTAENSVEEGKKMFEWLLYPLTYEAFLQDTWEKRVYHGQHNNKEYYSSVLSLQTIDQILWKHNIKFTKNIDITSYTNGERHTHNPLGRATADRVWGFFEQGFSVRLLNPQTFIPQVGMVVSVLQELFQCMVGANVYLTPQNSQGFAPHYDDIDAFVLQIEGSKHWRVYEPRTSNDELPRYSSKNLKEEDIGDPILDIVLKAGDVLYFPRGFIHQANTLDEHSLHVTISCNQQNSWGDFMEKMIPAALKLAVDDDVEFRKGLPPRYLNYVGSSHSDLADHPEREAFYKKLRSLFDKLWDHLPVDASADQMAKDFMYNAYPPVLSSGEFERTSIRKQMQISLSSNVKLLRANILRLVMEEQDEDTITVYHYADNSREYHGEDQQHFEIPINHALGVEHLVNSYPKYIQVDELPLESDEEKIELVSDLWQRGLLLTPEEL